jgi:hypothetical protein
MTVVAGDYDQDWTPGDNKEEGYVFHVGPAEDVDVLVVDDDNSEGSHGLTTPYWYTNTEHKMLRGLEGNDMEYHVYTVEYNETGPTASLMDQYEAVVWMTGLDNEYGSHAWRSNYLPNKKVWDISLKDDDLEQLELFLSNPSEVKKLWVISPGYLYDYYGDGSSITAPADFANAFMHIDRCNANETERNSNGDITVQGTPNPLEGVADSIMDKVSYTTYDSTPPFLFTDIGGWVLKSPTDKDTKHLFYQDSAHFNFNALQYKGKDFMTAFFAFNFYLLNDETERKDCVYRVLTGFGMTGGVLVNPYNNQEKLKTVSPGQEINFRFIVTNTGKRDDTMTMSVTKNSKYSNWLTWFEIDGVRKNTVAIQGLKDKNRVYLYVQAPEMDNPADYPSAGTMVGFTVKAVSQNTDLENSTKVHARVLAVGDITIDSPEPEDTIAVKETARFTLRLLNETNGVDDVTVYLSFSGSGKSLGKFSKKGTTAPEVEAILEPNIVYDDIELHITSGDHTVTGYHNVTVQVKDEADVVLDHVNLSVFVTQFYQVKCTTDGDLVDNEVDFVIDPNNFTDEEEDYIKKSFTINVQNFGNGFDDILLAYEENDDSDDTSDWIFGVLSPDDLDAEEDLPSIKVSYYNENNNPEHGEEQVQFDVYIPMDVEVGTYIIDFYIESSHIEIINPAEDEDENNRVSFQFVVIKPNLRFTPFNNRDNADNYEFWNYNEALKIQRDFLLDNKFYIEEKHADFDFLSIEFKVYIDNIGDSDIDLEPLNLWLNITHKNDFGDTVYDANLTPNFPSSSKIISPDQNESYTFLWEFIDQPEDTEVEYTFEITVDPKEEIYEKDENDNSDSVTITINHLKKPKKESSGSPGFETAVLIAAIAFVLIAMFDYRRRRH